MQQQLISFTVFILVVFLQQEVAGEGQRSSCPKQYGLQTYPHPRYCDQFYKCANGTLTLETCGHGLLFDGKGGVHNFCNYFWGVNCGDRVSDLKPYPENAPCIYDYGIFPTAKGCDVNYLKCEAGDPYTFPCEAGLGYDERIHGCNWPDLVPGCDAEQIAGFKCPDPNTLPANSTSLKFGPFPRFAVPSDCRLYIICLKNSTDEWVPRLYGCEPGTVFDESTLTCKHPRDVPQCANHRNSAVGLRKSAAMNRRTMACSSYFTKIVRQAQFTGITSSFDTTKAKNDCAGCRFANIDGRKLFQNLRTNAGNFNADRIFKLMQKAIDRCATAINRSPTAANRPAAAIRTTAADNRPAAAIRGPGNNRGGGGGGEAIKRRGDKLN